MSEGYTGKIKQGGSQVVEAPHQVKRPKGSAVVKTGKDLRSGKK